MRKPITPDVKLIAFDLDGTLLDSNKDLSKRTLRALCEASARGIELVPCTGRFFDAMPKVVKDLPFVNYAITINGAEVFDVRRRASLYQAVIPNRTALSIMEYGDTPRSAIRYATLCVRTLVFPEPAPARIRSGPLS